MKVITEVCNYEVDFRKSQLHFQLKYDITFLFKRGEVSFFFFFKAFGSNIWFSVSLSSQAITGKLQELANMFGINFSQNMIS